MSRPPRTVAGTLMCLALWAGAQGVAQEYHVGAREATGVVYWDANSNGQRDEGEAGAADIAVATGQSALPTGPDGRWQIAQAVHVRDSA